MIAFDMTHYKRLATYPTLTNKPKTCPFCKIRFVSPIPTKKFCTETCKLKHSQKVYFKIKVKSYIQFLEDNGYTVTEKGA